MEQGCLSVDAGSAVMCSTAPVFHLFDGGQLVACESFSGTNYTLHAFIT